MRFNQCFEGLVIIFLALLVSSYLARFFLFPTGEVHLENALGQDIVLECRGTVYAIYM